VLNLIHRDNTTCEQEPMLQLGANGICLCPSTVVFGNRWTRSGIGYILKNVGLLARLPANCGDVVRQIISGLKSLVHNLISITGCYQRKIRLSQYRNHAGLLTCTTISNGDRLGAQLCTLASLIYIGRLTGHRVAIFSDYIHNGVGIRFLDVFQFLPQIYIIGRQYRVHRVRRKLFKLFGESFAFLFLRRKSIHRVVSKCDRILGEFERIRVRQSNNFIGFNLSAGFPQNIPNLKVGKNYDIVGDFSFFLPLWVNEFNIISQAICFAPQVLKEAVNIINRYKQLCSPKKLLGLHFRRGDYLACSSLNLCNEYYDRALNFFPPDEWSLLIFSDDIAYCKNLPLFSSYTVAFSSEDSDVMDMALMSLCGGLITANSTFSLWGGLMGGHIGRPVVCPEQFFGERDSFHSQLNGIWFPQGWISLDIQSTDPIR